MKAVPSVGPLCRVSSSPKRSKRDAVVLGFDDEVGRVAVAGEQIAARRPVADRRRSVPASQRCHERQRVVRVARDQRARRPPALLVVHAAPRRSAREIEALRQRSLASAGRKRGGIGSPSAWPHDLRTATAGARVESRLRHRAERLVAHRLAVIDEHDVAERHADLETRPLLHRQAQREGQRVGGVPGDLGDRQRAHPPAGRRTAGRTDRRPPSPRSAGPPSASRDRRPSP